LTGSLLSLRAFRTQLELDVARADRYGRSLSVALMDIDRFRKLNLEHGYANGDAVLEALGQLIAERTRDNDLACRMGGDEFAILFSETEGEQALEAVERILLELEDLEARSSPELDQGNVFAALASALEQRDRYTGEHSESVVDLTARVGDALGLAGEDIAQIRTGALLHDIARSGCRMRSSTSPASSMIGSGRSCGSTR
jgi:diguanylate cyclase (GGDEF)-like protein